MTGVDDFVLWLSRRKTKMVVVINELAYTIVGAPTARESDPSLILIYVFSRIPASCRVE